MSSGATPGPWAVDYEEGWIVGGKTAHGLPILIADLNWFDGGPQETANARLISAAPDLKDSTSALLFWIAQGNFSALPVPAIEYMHKAIKEAEAAIAKAESAS